MKKLLCFVLSFVFLFVLCSCGSTDTESKHFSQAVTIVKMPSPPKCKTTDDISIIEEVITVLGEIDKSPISSTAGDNANGWKIMIKLNIDGEYFNYTIGGVFTDSDGTQYSVSNFKEIEEKITQIYNEIDAPEIDYP